MSDLRLHHAPRIAAVNDEPFDLLIAALAQLSLRNIPRRFDPYGQAPRWDHAGLAWAASRIRIVTGGDSAPLESRDLGYFCVELANS